MFSIILISIVSVCSADYDFSEFGEEVEHGVYCKEDGEFTRCTHLTLARDVEDDHHRRRLADHYWTNYTWSNPSCNLVLPIGDCHTSGSFSTLLDDVVYRWNNVPENQDLSGDTYSPVGISLQKTTCDGDDNLYCNDTSVLNRISSCNGNYGDTGWAGLASIWTYGDNTLAKASSQVNEYYSMSNAETQHVLCQEIGHGFPMGHTSEDGSDQNTCMDYSTWTSANRYPNKNDVQLIDNLYCGDEDDSSTDSGDDDVEVTEEWDYTTLILLIIIVIGISLSIILICYLLYKCCCQRPEEYPPGIQVVRQRPVQQLPMIVVHNGVIQQPGALHPV